MVFNRGIVGRYESRTTMACQNCGATVQVSKGLRVGKAGRPDECPECGVELESYEEEKSLLRK